MSKPESQILKEIHSWLTEKGFISWRNHVFNGRVKGGYLRTGIPGLSDLTVMLKGYHLYIEVKTATGKQREAQECFETSCKLMGHEYIIARSVEDVELKLKELGVI